MISALPGMRSIVVVALAALLACADMACAQDAPKDVSFGDRLYHDKADCQFCHGVNGDGHGDPRDGQLRRSRLAGPLPGRPPACPACAGRGIRRRGLGHSPAAARSASALSVRSHAKSGSSRPKWP